MKFAFVLPFGCCYMQSAGIFIFRLYVMICVVPFLYLIPLMFSNIFSRLVA